jgi:hypothetical protein
VIVARNNKTEERRVIYCKEGFRWEYLTTIKTIKQINEKLGNSLKVVAVDSTGMGDPVAEALMYQDVGGEPLGEKVYPVRFTLETKERMMSWLIQLLQQERLKITPEFRRLIIQMRLQKAEVKGGRIHYSHPTGGEEAEAFSYHDDLLWALNLALWGDYNFPSGYFGKGVSFLKEAKESKRSKYLQTLKKLFRRG